MQTKQLRTVYTVTVVGTSSAAPKFETPYLTEAIRAWDRYANSMHNPSGGIEVQSFDENGTMVRDGWILHVYPDGGRMVYLNPNLGDLAVQVMAP